MSDLTRIKLQYYLPKFFGFYFKKTFIFNRENFLQPATTALFFIFIYFNFGNKIMVEKVYEWVLLQNAYLYAFTAWMFLNIFICVYKFYNREKDFGQWKNKDFFLKQPQIVFSTIVMQEQTMQRFDFKIKDIPKNCFVLFQIYCDGGVDLIKVGIGPYKCQHPNGGQFAWHRTGCKIGHAINNKRISLFVMIDPRSIPQNVTVKMLSWTLQ